MTLQVMWLHMCPTTPGWKVVESRSPHCDHRGPLYCVYTVIAAIIGPTGVRGTISQEISCFQVNWKYQ